MDLLNDMYFENLLRLCASGLVAYCGASPPCSEFSLLKLRSPGPTPVRTHEFPLGIPNPTPTEQDRIQRSRELLHRAVCCLQHTFAAGGHGHLESSPNAFTWYDPVVKSWVHQQACHCVVLAACQFSLNISKHWMFACSHDWFVDHASQCSHSNHSPYAGIQDESGTYLSRKTAEYPKDLATALAHKLSAHIGPCIPDLTLEFALSLIPVKPLHDPPHALRDGGGRGSQPDWSFPPNVPDVLKPLRDRWIALILEQNLHKQFVAHMELQNPDPPFSEECIEKFQEVFSSWIPTDWSVRPHQPMCLNALHHLSQRIHDPDSQVFPCLIAGVSAGTSDDPIRASQIFWERDLNSDTDPPSLQIHRGNWKSSEDHPELTWELIQTEIDQGWVFEFDGDETDAQQEYPQGVGLGKLGIAFSDSRPPRLVLDSSVCNTNQNCIIPERQCYPSARDVVESFPLRQCSEPQHAATFDIKSAHKRIVLSEHHQGLVGFTFQGRLFFYRVCPFGATFSAFWWGRLGAWLVRVWHRLIWVQHGLWLFVDDFLLTQPKSILPLFATLLALFCRVFRIPLSWKKCTLGPMVDWIGWRFNFFNGLVSIHPDKQSKLIAQIEELLNHRHCSSKQLERFTGLALWITQLFLPFRALLHWLFSDLHTCPATHYSVAPGYWTLVKSCLSDDLTFISSPSGTAIPKHSKLLSVRHTPVQTLQEVEAVRLTDRRLWLRIVNPSSQQRKLSVHSRRVLKLWLQWLTVSTPLRTMRPSFQAPIQAAADASAQGDQFQVGGFVASAQQVFWFSEQWHVHEIKKFDIPVRSEAQRDIACYETLAQAFLVLLCITLCPHACVPLHFKSLSDNAATEASGNKLFTTSAPLCYFVEHLAHLLVSARVSCDISHIPGILNQDADLLSRWNFHDSLPVKFTAATRHRMSLEQFFSFHRGAQIYPETFPVQWSISNH